MDPEITTVNKKKIIHRCYGYKKFRSTPFRRPTAGELTKDRTEGYRSFQVVGVDFARPIILKIKERKKGKAYIILFCDSLSLGLYLEILNDQT